MNIQIKTSAAEIEVTGEQGEIVFTHRAENVELFLNSGALLNNLASLAQQFMRLDAQVKRTAKAEG